MCAFCQEWNFVAEVCPQSLTLILMITGLVRFLHLGDNLINHHLQEETGWGGLEIGQQEPGVSCGVWQSPSWRMSGLLNDLQKNNE